MLRYSSVLTDMKLQCPLPRSSARVAYPMWTSTFDNHILFLIGGDEQRMNPEELVPEIIAHLNKTGRRNVSMQVNVVEVVVLMFHEHRVLRPVLPHAF